MTSTIDVRTRTLRDHGFRATRGRLTLLSILDDSRAPLSVGQIEHIWKGEAPDTATLYRMLTDFTEAGITARITLTIGTAHYELADRPHHHHIICNDCGKIEDVAAHDGRLEARTARVSNHFASIYAHSLEFFGRCKHCAR